MLKAVLLSTAALALIATSANAASNVTLSKDGRFTSVLPHSGKSAPAHTGAKYVVSTVDKSKVGAYFCCYGSTISGPSSIIGAAYGVAEQFIPTSAATVSKIVAGIGYVSGDDKVTLTLYADNGSNSPGAKIASGKATSTTEFGFCCGLVTARIGSQNLKANTPYWVGITASGADWNAAPFQVNNEVNDYHYLANTSNGGSTWGSGYSETEYNPAIALE
ncbi:MAG TPA: hypothetical protein VKR31_13845 [Rhizomicrobium sp.]|nr:hypothetical protein [Rhizomicrobium sp.]